MEGYIYILYDPLLKLSKVGRSLHSGKRLKQHRGAYPSPLVMMAEIKELSKTIYNGKTNR